MGLSCHPEGDLPLGENKKYFHPNRRGGRVVEGGSLENCYTRNGIASSNLALSALDGKRVSEVGGMGINIA